MGATPLGDLRAEVAAGRAVAVVGAGVSIAATGDAPAASWAGLLEDGVAWCDRPLGPGLPAGWAGRRRAQLAPGDTEELIPAAEDITRRLGGLDEYRRWLAQSVGPLSAPRPEVVDALAGPMRKALAATRTLVFVGCGAGLADPNFAELRGCHPPGRGAVPPRHRRL